MILKTPIAYDFYEGESPINFAAMNPKPELCIFRASVQFIGTRTRRQDFQVENYVAECKARGIKYGLYHFLSPNGIAEQAALFLSVWNKVGGADIAPIVDVEINLTTQYGGTIGNAVWQGHIKTFLDVVAAGTGKKPIIYTNRNYWNNFVCTKNLLSLVPPAWTSDYYLWAAQYPDLPDNWTAPSPLPKGWTKWAMWQYAQNGRTNGFLANDLNVLSDWYAAEIVPPPPSGKPFTLQVEGYQPFSGELKPNA